MIAKQLNAALTAPSASLLVQFSPSASPLFGFLMGQAHHPKFVRSMMYHNWLAYSFSQVPASYPCQQ